MLWRVGVLVTTVLTGLAVTPARAVTVDGVTFTPGDVFAASIFQNMPTEQGSLLFGIGQVTQITSAITGLSSGPVCAGCELNFVVNNFQNTSGPGSTLTFGGPAPAYIAFWVDPIGTFNPNAGEANSKAIASGKFWLGLWHDPDPSKPTLTVSFDQVGSTTDATEHGVLQALLGGGDAAAYFTGAGGMPFIAFSAALSDLNPPGDFEFGGNAEFRAPVPEPATLAILAPGIMALGLLRRRRRARAQPRQRMACRPGQAARP